MQKIRFDELYRRYFQLIFRADPRAGHEREYKDFVRSFYKGSWVADGWIETTENVVRARGRDARAVMNELGQLVAGEWAKPNPVRTINTDHLKKWGREMKSAQLPAIKGRIDEVRGMLPDDSIPIVEYDRLEL